LNPAPSSVFKPSGIFCADNDDFNEFFKNTSAEDYVKKLNKVVKYINNKEV